MTAAIVKYKIDFYYIFKSSREKHLDYYNKTIKIDKCKYLELTKKIEDGLNAQKELYELFNKNNNWRIKRVL